MRTHTHTETFQAPAPDVFALLHTPSAICDWWGADRAIVIPQEGGFWAAAWGLDVDDPDYVTAATIAAFEPPYKLFLSDYTYYARTGALPFAATFTTTFTVAPLGPHRASLRVAQSGFPDSAEGDAFLAACEKGWKDTFAGIRRFLATTNSLL